MKRLGYGCGIALAEGQEWKRKRKVLSSLFSFDFMNDLLDRVDKTTLRLID